MYIFYILIENVRRRQKKKIIRRFEEEMQFIKNKLKKWD